MPGCNSNSVLAAIDSMALETSIEMEEWSQKKRPFSRYGTQICTFGNGNCQVWNATTSRLPHNISSENNSQTAPISHSSLSMSTLLRKRIAANRSEQVSDTNEHDVVPFSVTKDLHTPIQPVRDGSHIIAETPMFVEGSTGEATATGSRSAVETPMAGCKRKRGAEWPKERLVLEYQKLMKLRIQASIATADAAEARRRAVAASGSVVEQERSILAHVAKRAQRAFHTKQEALEMHVAQYEKSRTDSKHAFDQVDAMKSAVEMWEANLNQSPDGDSAELEIIESSCLHFARAVP